MREDGAVLITGAAGFIGSHLARALVEQGERVVGVDNFDDFYERAVKERNIADLIGSGRFTLHEADICDEPAMRVAMDSARPRLVVHLAAKAGVRPSIAEPRRYAEVNVAGTANVLESARQAGCGDVLFASSSSVYGDRAEDDAPFSEEDDVERPASPYAATKRAGELICRTFCDLHGMRIACLRFFTVFGPGQRPDLAIAKFMRLLSRNEPLPIFGDGSTARDYTFIDDIVEGILASGRRLAREPHGFWRLWNLGNSSPILLRDLVDELETVTSRTARIDRQPIQAGDVSRTYADLARVRSDLDWSPRTSLRDGLKRQWDAWCAPLSSTARE